MKKRDWASELASIDQGHSGEPLALATRDPATASSSVATKVPSSVTAIMNMDNVSIHAAYEAVVNALAQVNLRVKFLEAGQGFRIVAAKAGASSEVVLEDGTEDGTEEEHKEVVAEESGLGNGWLAVGLGLLAVLFLTRRAQ